MNYTSKEVYEFISQKNNDPIVEWKICKVSGTEFPIYESDLKFYDKISPTINGVKYQIPSPTLCPEERLRRRSAFRNERKLYRRKCDATGEAIISLYSPNKPYRVYNNKFRFSDKWNALDYGRDFDFSKTFNEQFNQLLLDVPHLNLYVKNSENSDYNSIVEDSKDCYMCVSTGYCQNVMYSTLTGRIEDCVDNYWLINSKSCYECIDCDKCYDCSYLQNCEECSFSSYLKDCKSSSYCMFGVGLSSKKYCILNKEYSEEEYFALQKDIQNNASRKQEFLQKFEELKKSFPSSNYHNNTEKSYGAMLRNCKNAVLCYGAIDCVDSKYCVTAGLSVNDVYDCSGGDIYQTKLSYECAILPIGYNILFSYSCWDCSQVLYCFDCFFCSNCFGCTGLTNKQYCIFNKQYTKEEYEQLLSQIIIHMKDTAEWGEFFSPSLSPFGYSETVAQIHDHITKEVAIRLGYKWEDQNFDPSIPAGTLCLKGSEVPSDIGSVSDDILKAIIICEVTDRPFRLVKQELEFYRKHNLPLPTKHPDQRHLERVQKRPSQNFYLCNCSKCGDQMLGWSDDKSIQIYCETCYNKEVYG